MPGLMQSTQQEPQQPANQNQGEMDLPPQFKEAYERVVIAGMKVMFDPATHQMMVQQLEQEGPIEDRLSEGIIGLIVILYKQAKNMPPEVIIPAAVTLLKEAVEFVRKTGTDEVTEAQYGTALEKTVYGVMEKFGANPQEVVAKLETLKGNQNG